MVKKLENKKKSEHIHIWDIPKKYFPRKTKAKDYAEDLIRVTKALNYTNQRVQYGAQICAFSIKSINQKAGFLPSPPETFRSVEEFVYHYENYCYRLYAYREKLLQFINAVLPVGYTDKQVKIDHILINPIVKQAKLLSLLEKFKKNGSLSKVIQDRNSLTHKLYYGKDFDHFFRPKTEMEFKTPENFEKWCDNWRNQIMSRATLTNLCTRAVSDINAKISQKIINYKNIIKSSHL